MDFKIWRPSRAHERKRLKGCFPLHGSVWYSHFLKRPGCLWCMRRTAVTQRFWSHKMDIHFHASFNQKMTTAASNVRCNKCPNNADAGTLAHPTKCTNNNKKKRRDSQNPLIRFPLSQYPHSLKSFASCLAVSTRGKRKWKGLSERTCSTWARSLTALRCWRE